MPPSHPESGNEANSQVPAIPSSVPHTNPESAATLAARPRVLRRAQAQWHPDPVAWLLAIASGALFVTYAVAQWNAYIVPSWDLGIFTELAQQYAHLHAPIVDIKGPGYNLLGDHFHPLLILTGPIFRIFPSGLTLLVLQAVLFAWSIVPITRYARKKLGALWGTLLGVAYALSWGLTEAIQAQFHEIAFAVPLLAFGIVFWLEGRNRAAFLTLGLLVFIKEDMGLTVAMFGVILLWIAWGKRSLLDARSTTEASHPLPFPLRTWKSLRATLNSRESTPALWLLLWGIFWFLAAVVVILPLLNPHGGWDYTRNIGEVQDTAPGLLGFFTSLFGPGQKIVTVGLLVIALGVLGLRSPLWWLMVPTLAWRFAGNVEYYWGWEWHYSAILMPIAALSLIDGVVRMKETPQLRTSWQRSITGIAVVISLAGSLSMVWDGPLGTLTRGELNATESQKTAAQGAIDAVGTGRHVVSDLTLLAYLVPGNTVYWEGSVGTVVNAELFPSYNSGRGPDAVATIDTIVISPGHPNLTESLEPASWATQKYGGTWDVVYSEFGYTVLKLAEK